MPQKNNASGSCPEFIDSSGRVNQVKSSDPSELLNALGTFATSRLLSLIAPWKELIKTAVIKELIRASESKMFVKGGYGEKWHQTFNGNVWPHFAEKEIENWVKESPDYHTADLRQVIILRDLLDTDVNDRTTWQRLFEIYVRLFRFSDPPRMVSDAMELIKLKLPPMPDNFFDSSKILLNTGSVNEDNTLTVSRVLETDARKTFEELAKGLFSQRHGNVKFILQAPEKLQDLAFQESFTLGEALPKAPDLNNNIMNDVGDFTTSPLQVELRHIRLQYGTWIGLFAFKKVFPNFLVVKQDKLMSVRGNIVSETGTDAVQKATFMRMPAGSIGLQGLGMWLKPQVSDETRKKLYEEAHPKLEMCDENILSVLIERENKICENLKGDWQNFAPDRKIPDALSPNLSLYYSKCQESLKTSRADDVRWLYSLIEILGNCQYIVRKDLEYLKQESKGILWK